MPYTPPNFVDGTTPLNQTNMNALGTQYSEAMQSLNQDLLSAFVETGLVASRHNSYASTVLADAPLRYYRLDETSASVPIAYDFSGNGRNGQTAGFPTLGVAGALTGDPDTAYTFAAGSSQTVSVPNVGLPTGNSAISLECWFKFAANPAATQALIGYGHNPSAAHQDMYLYIDSSGRLNVDFQTGAAVTSAAVSTGAWHHAVATWDGTTLRLYLDGVSVGTPITPGAQAIPTSGAICNVAALATGGNDFSGQIDEVAIYGTALSSTRVSAHYTNGTTATTQVDLTAGEIVSTQSDSTTRRRAVGSASFTTSTINTTYYLYAQPDGTTYWSTANTPAANSLAIAQVTTDGSGNVKLVTDVRPRASTPLPNADMGYLTHFLASVSRVTITDTTQHNLIVLQILTSGTYRLSAALRIGNGTTPNKPAFTVNFTGLTGAQEVIYFYGNDGTSVHQMDGTVASFGASFSTVGIPPEVVDINPGWLIIAYQTTGTPNDIVSAFVERLA